MHVAGVNSRRTRRARLSEEKAGKAESEKVTTEIIVGKLA